MTASALVRAGQFNQAARQGAYILIALALPRLGVPRELIGEWETLLFLGYLLGFGWTTGLLQGFLVKMGALPDQSAVQFARRAVQVMGGISAGLLLLVALLHQPFFTLLQIEREPVGWYLFFVLLLSRWPSYCFEQALLLQGQARALVGYAVLNSLGLLAALLLPLYLGHSLLQAVQTLGAFAGAKVIVLLLWTLRPARSTPTASSPLAAGTLAGWLRASRPLVAYATVGALVTAADPWLVNFWYGGDPEVFAVFRYGVRELPFLAALISGMTVVAIPLITRDRTAGLVELRSQSRKLFHYVFVLALTMLLTADYWWTRVFTPTFADSLPVFRTYLLVVGCRLVFAMSVLTALTETRRIYLWGVLELVVNVVLSLLLAPRFGLVGIVWGTVLASYFHEACLVLYLRYRTGIAWREFADLGWYFGYLTVLFVAYWAI
ncbi:polysaccharide biosynthesis C-terminal domain-containing protein [Neolewinella sp.]|uniref:polysaccharide biosynthesis C-terminal domain-containing protein n=1 Tax=Neolewinella sp. TaxID=2993543 RepID=UPI003B52FCA6